MLENLFGKSETEQELEEFRERRKYERMCFEAAMKDWLLHSGLAPIMMEQTKEFANECGLENWDESDQFDHYMYGDFDPRNPRHQEIAEYIDEQKDG